jgi:hypothetical protein
MAQQMEQPVPSLRADIKGVQSIQSKQANKFWRVGISVEVRDKVLLDVQNISAT